MHANRDTVNRLFGLGLYDLIPYEDLELEAPEGENAEHVATIDSCFPHKKAMELLLKDPKYVLLSISGFDSDAAPDRFDPYEENSHRICPEYDHNERFQTALGDPIAGILLFAALFKKHIRPEHVSSPVFATGALHEGNLFASKNAREFLEKCISHIPWNLVALTYLVTKAHLGAKNLALSQAKHNYAPPQLIENTRARARARFVLCSIPVCTHASNKLQANSQAVVRGEKERAEEAQPLWQADQDIVQGNGEAWRLRPLPVRSDIWQATTTCNEKGPALKASP